MARAERTRMLPSPTGLFPPGIHATECLVDHFELSGYRIDVAVARYAIGALPPGYYLAVGGLDDPLLLTGPLAESPSEELIMSLIRGLPAQQVAD